MNAWVLSMIICSAAPAADGSFCNANALAFGLTETQCRAEVQRWSRHAARPRLECTNDPALTAYLAEHESEPALAKRRQPGPQTF